MYYSTATGVSDQVMSGLDPGSIANCIHTLVPLNCMMYQIHYWLLSMFSLPLWMFRELGRLSASIAAIFYCFCLEVSVF